MPTTDEVMALVGQRVEVTRWWNDSGDVPALFGVRGTLTIDEPNDPEVDEPEYTSLIATSDDGDNYAMFRPYQVVRLDTINLRGVEMPHLEVDC